MANVLITGGAGYVGAVVTGAFLDAGHTVTVLDRLDDGGQGLLGYVPQTGFRFLAGDVRDERVVAEGRARSRRAPALGGYRRLWRVQRRSPARRVRERRRHAGRCSPPAIPGQLVLYASTGSVYGAVPAGLCHEGLEPTPLSRYGSTKLAAERLIVENGNAVAFRFATAFGMSPSMRIDLLVNGFVYSAKRRGYLVVYDKDARRTFIHVRDMARAFLFALDNCAPMSGQVYNAGSDSLNHTKDEIAQLILARHRYFLTYGPVGVDEDQRDYAVSYQKLGALGFTTEISLEEGIDELLRGMDLLHYRAPYGDA